MRGRIGGKRGGKRRERQRDALMKRKSLINTKLFFLSRAPK